MKIPFNQAPFAGMLFAFLSGFLICCFTPDRIHGIVDSVLFLTAVFGLMLYYFIPALNQSWRWRFLPGISLFFLMAGLGVIFLSGAMDAGKMPETNKKIDACVKILSHPKEKARSLQCPVKIMTASDRAWRGKKIMLGLPKDSMASSLRVGDCLLIRCHPVAIRNFNSGNASSSFDYAAYMKKKGFAASAYAAAGSWEKAGRGQPFSMMAYAEICRQYLLEVYAQNGISGDNLALVAALSLGKKDLMDTEMRTQFASAGVAHILAVSGMHVGIIYLIISKTLSWMDRRKWGRVLRQVMTIVLLWAYAILTGLSASVLRAVLMFSIVALGKCLNRKAVSWNSLCLSAFVMLCIRPLYIYDVGFQMSYIAVASILWLLPKFQLYIGKKNYLTDMLCLSLAAQIGTAPISIYYFHQFPNYFLFSNLLLVPLAVLITYNALALLVLSMLPSIAGLLSKILSVALSFFCRTAETIDTLPYAVSDNLYPSVRGVLSVYILLFLLFRLSENKRYIYSLNQISTILKNHQYDFKNYRRRTYSKN